MWRSEAAILQGVVAIGIAIGAVLAAAYVSLRRSVDVLPIGVLMGFSVAVMSFYKASWIPGGFDIFGFHISFAIAIACLLLVSVGMMAGFFVVPPPQVEWAGAGNKYFAPLLTADKPFTLYQNRFLYWDIPFHSRKSCDFPACLLK